MERTFRYTGYNLEGVFVKGKKTARRESEIRLQLEEEGLEIEALVSRPWDINLAIGNEKIKVNDLMIFTRLLSALLRSGINTPQALDVLYKQTNNPTLKGHILDVSMTVRKGARLSDAMRKHPKAFPLIYTEIITAGEKTGNLDTMLNRLARMLQRTDHISGRVKMASMYPAILLGTVVVIGGLLLYFIIPEFASIFERGGYDLPRATIILLGLSEMLRNSGFLIAAGISAAGVLLTRAVKVATIKEQFDRFVLKVPVIGNMVLTGAMANYCMVMRMALSSGLVVVDALRLSTETIGNRRISLALKQALNEVSTGSRLAAALERTNIVPPLVVAVTTVGEASGDLEEQYDMTADFYEEQVLYEVDRALKLLEPALIILVFGAVALLLIAVYSPLFEATAIMG